MRTTDIRAFVQGYMVCALWSSCGPDATEPYTCGSLDELFGPEDIAPEARRAMLSDCVDFIRSNRADLEKYAEAIRCYPSEGGPWAYAGHDFWLTRNRHGAGFWDRGLGALGDRLSDAAKAYGGCDLWPGDDGRVYL